MRVVACRSRPPPSWSAHHEAWGCPLRIPISMNIRRYRMAEAPGRCCCPRGQAVWAFAGRSGEPLYSEDVPLVEGLRAALIKRGFKERTAKGHVDSLLRLGRWLVKHSKQGIAQRLHDSTLDSDAAAFEEIGGRGILTALGHLRTSQVSGGGGLSRGLAPLLRTPSSSRSTSRLSLTRARRKQRQHTSMELP
ncbi:hypothetical protein ACVMB0_007548 [Bradyrhizobium sp. USDA 4451]